MRSLPPAGDVRLELSPSPPVPLPVLNGSPADSSVRLMAASRSLVPDRLRLPLCFLGVFVCYFYYGILQEKITRGKYGEGPKQETFTFALTLVFIQCVINAMFAKICEYLIVICWAHSSFSHILGIDVDSSLKIKVFPYLHTLEYLNSFSAVCKANGCEMRLKY